MSNPYIVGYTRDEEKVIALFSSLTLIYNENNEYIEYFGAQSGDNIYKLKSVDGMNIEILNLKCKSYEEVLVQMDLHDLLHGKEISDEIRTTDTQTDNALKKKIKALAEENKKLKLKLKQLKILIDK